MSLMQQVARVNASREAATRADEFVALARYLMIGQGSLQRADRRAIHP